MVLSDEIRNRILILDGAMGSLLQQGICEEDILRRYIDAGADIISTNSFSANRIVQGDLCAGTSARTMAHEAAKRARRIADAAPRKIYVAGSVGPTDKSLTIAGSACDPCFRKYSFAELKDVFKEQIGALVDGGADLILLETQFDALNTKAAIAAAEELENPLPLIISATVSDASGRTLTGQTLEAFYRSVEYAPGLIAFGINCALGAERMAPLLYDIARFSHHPTIFYPNAGIPDAFGRYNDSPATMARIMESLADKGLINIAGGCCGTTDSHIKAVAEALRGKTPRPVPEREDRLFVSGLESVCLERSGNFISIGERTNVAGSRKFARLMASREYAEAAEVAAGQIRNGAGVIDINMDDPMLDSPTAMRDFLRYVSGEPDVAKAAVMIDSSHWGTVLEGLQNTQGKCIVNSISLRDGEAEFLRKARVIRSFGAAMVVMAFDEEGQAVTYCRKIEICARSYKLLTEQADVPPEEIIFDCNILSIGTGIAEHARFGIDFIEAVRWIKANLPGAKTSGGLSNLSFAFRGNNRIREAMHSVFLYHAISAGLDMAIMNPGMVSIFDDIDPELKQCVSDVIFNTDPEATARLVNEAQREVAGKEIREEKQEKASDCMDTLTNSLIRGSSDGLETTVLECMKRLDGPVAVIEGPLMAAMERVGEMFSSGKMFLPQVVKSARIMREAVRVLHPYMKASDKNSSKPKFVIATVQGDVHDIGKNITSIVLQCSGFDVIDLGVMVPAADIVSAAEREGAACVGVSGLITPSLQRMEEICREMDSRGMDIPLFVGGAAASALHTAVKLSPLYSKVYYCSDASTTAVKAKKHLADPQGFDKDEKAAMAAISMNIQKKSLPQKGNFTGDGFLSGKHFSDFGPLELGWKELEPHFDWRLFAAVCGIKGEVPEGITVEARTYLESEGVHAKVTARFFDCHRDGNDIASSGFSLPMLRDGGSLADYFPIEGSSQLGLFSVCVGGSEEGLVAHAARVSLAEAASEYLRGKWTSELPEGFRLITPGIGYPCCPDHSLKRDLLGLLPDTGIKLTDSCAMIPEASICGLVIAHEKAEYNDIRIIDIGQLQSYARRRGMTDAETHLFLGHYL